MSIAKAALARYATKEAAWEAAEKLARNGFVIKRIPTAREYRHISGPTIGWCAIPVKPGNTLLSAMIHQFLSQLFGYVTEAELQSLGIPKGAALRHYASRNVLDHIVVVAGTPEQMQQGIQLLRSTALRDLDLY